jgi:hypothetical protein
MIRVLAMIAVAGFLVSAVTLSIAAGIVGPDAIANGAWSWTSHGWGGHGWRHDRSDDGPQTRRDIAWSGGDSLDIDLDADVQYTQAPGAPKLTVTGPKGAVEDVIVDDGRIRYAKGRDHDAQLTIVVSAPAVTSFTLEGSGAMAIAGYKQDKLTLAVEGDASIKASGEAKTVELKVEGSGDADLSALKTQSAKIDVEGSGNATLAPTDAAEVDIAGSGDVTLLTNPAKLQTHISGSGEVHRKGEEKTE